MSEEKLLALQSCLLFCLEGLPKIGKGLLSRPLHRNLPIRIQRPQLLLVAELVEDLLLLD